MALTKYNFNSFDLTTAASKGLAFNSDADGFETSSAGSMTLIKTLTASSSSTLDFVNGSSSVVFDNTYPVYLFKFINMHPATNNVDFSFQADTGTNTSYNQTMTTTAFYSENSEASGGGGSGYSTGRDQAQGTSFQQICDDIGNGNDEGCSGFLHIFNPASSTFVKHFISRMHGYHEGNYAQTWFHAGYFNTTTALTRVRFKFSSGNIDAGTIKLYGIKDS